MMGAHRLVEFFFFRLEGDGVSRKEAAKMAGVTERMLSNYVTGHRQPRIEILERMLKSVGYDLCAVHEKKGDNNV